MHADKNDIVNRLSIAEGHVKAIKKMVEEDKACGAILLQLSAVQSSIEKIAKYILKEHLNHCVKESIQRGEEDLLAEFNTLLDKYI